MCGIIGFAGPNTPDNRELLAKLLYESSIRGVHSMGMAWVEQDRVEGISSGVDPCADFLKAVFIREKHIKMIGHCRYSTSDLEWPLPILCEHPNPEVGAVAITLNGVISQDTPDKWPQPPAGDVDYVTGNDAEVALKWCLSGCLPLLPGSWAFGLLSRDHLNFYRNGDRPLWVCNNLPEFSVVASTQDILLRCDLTPEHFPNGTAYDALLGKSSRVQGLFGHPDQQIISPNTSSLQCKL